MGSRGELFITDTLDDGFSEGWEEAVVARVVVEAVVGVDEEAVVEVADDVGVDPFE